MAEALDYGWVVVCVASIDAVNVPGRSDLWVVDESVLAEVVSAIRVGWLIS